MRRLALHLLIAFAAFTLGIIVSLPWRFVNRFYGLPRRDVVISVADNHANDEFSEFDVDSESFHVASEISVERIHDGCLGCGDRKTVFRRAAAKRHEHATVTEIDLHSKTERQGELDPYYFNKLLRLIEEQDYFSMKGHYGMGWVDSLIVRIDVRVGDKHKRILTSNEGDVPIRLWGIYYAIEGARANVKWQTSSQPNKRLGQNRQ
jgi:hypothetical protein